jgi:hypothetical protein
MLPEIFDPHPFEAKPQELRDGGLVGWVLEKHTGLRGQPVAFACITGATTANTVFERGRTGSRPGNNVVDGHLAFALPAIAAAKTIPNEHIAFTEGDSGSVNGPDQFDQLQDGRNPHGQPTGRLDDLLGIAQYSDLVVDHQTHGAFPVDHVHKRVVCVQ